MRLADTHRLLGFLRGLTVPASSDTDLLHRFVSHREEAAFAELVSRHGPMVRGVCLRLLGNHADADDVFQATFLILARRAGSVRQPGAIGAWLHGVACRLARKLRNRPQRVMDLDPQIPVTDPADPFAEACWQELRGLLDEELERLSESFRLPLVLCYLQELTRDEAAARLGWSVRTLDRRLRRGRELLQARLRRRGVEAAALATAALGVTKLTAAVPPELAASTTRFALAFALGKTLNGPSVMLAEGAMHMLAMIRWKWVAGMVMALGLLAAASTLLLPGADPAQQPSGGVKPNIQGPHAAVALPAGAVARLGSSAFHQGQTITRLHFSPDGQRILSLSNKNLIVWESASGNELLRLAVGNGENGDFQMATFTPDRKTIAAIYADGMARVWNADDGKELSARRLTDEYLDSTQVFPAEDGRCILILTIQKERRLTKWDPVNDHVRNIQAVVRLPGPDGNAGVPGPKGIQPIDVFANALGLATNGREALVHMTGERIATVTLNEKDAVKRFDRALDIRSVKALSPDGKWAAVVGAAVDRPDPNVAALARDALYLWDVPRGILVRSLNWPLQNRAQLRCAFAPDSRSLFVANGPAVVRWDVGTGRILRQWTNFSELVTALAVSPDGSTLAVASDGSVRLFDATSGAEKFDSRHTASVDVLAFAPDGKTLYTGSADRTMRQWEVSSGKHLRVFDEHLAGVTALSVSPDGKWIASAGSTNRPNVIRLWDAANGQFIRQLRGHQDCVRSLAFSPTSQALASAAGDGVRVWWLQSGDELANSGKQARIAMAVAFPQQDTVALGTSREVGEWACSAKPPPKLWDLEEATIMRQNAGVRSSWLAGIAFSPQSGRVALAVSQDSIGNEATESSVVCCETATGRVLRRLMISGPLICVAISTKGKKVAAGDSEGRIRIWDVDTGAEKAVYMGHSGPVRSLAFSPDGQHLASGGADTTSLIWTVP
jgi:RNA polymerase sigma factor (sigma-70 family)